MPLRAGDSHTVALTQQGAIWAWGTFRDSSGVLGFSPSERIALLPTLVHEPATADDQALKIASGASSHLVLDLVVILRSKEKCKIVLEYRLLAVSLQFGWVYQRLASVAEDAPTLSRVSIITCVARNLRQYSSGSILPLQLHTMQLPTLIDCSVVLELQKKMYLRSESKFDFENAGADHVMALTRGGALMSWGNGQQGQLGRVGSRMRNLKDTLLRPHPVSFTRRIRNIGVAKVLPSNLRLKTNLESSIRIDTAIGTPVPCKSVSAYQGQFYWDSPLLEVLLGGCHVGSPRCVHALPLLSVNLNVQVS